MPVCLHEGKRKNVDLSGSSLHLGRVAGGETVMRIVIFFCTKIYIFNKKKHKVPQQRSQWLMLN